VAQQGIGPLILAAMPSTPSRWPEIKALFDAVAEQPPGEREPLIATAALDASSLAELRSLLAHHDAAGAAPGFMRDAAAALGDDGRGPIQPPPQRIGERLGDWEIVPPWVPAAWARCSRRAAPTAPSKAAPLSSCSSAAWTARPCCSASRRSGRLSRA